MSLADASREALGWDLIHKAVTERKQAARERLLEEMQAAGSLKQGVVSDGASWGTASLTGGEDTAEVYDMHAVIAWTAAHRPDMLMQALNPAWLRLLLEIAKVQGQAIDPETGAIIPGIRRVTKPFGLLLRTTRQAQAAARGMIDQMAVGNLQIAAEEN